MKYLDKGKDYYKSKADNGIMCIVFIKRDGSLRVMLCTRNSDILRLYGCISKTINKDYVNNLGVVDILIDRPSYISLDRVLYCEYIGYLDLVTKGSSLGYKLYDKLNLEYGGLDVNKIITSNL